MAQSDLPFARDLGYLDKFLAALRGHAEGLPEPRRQELLRLLASEDGQWARIKALLGAEACDPPEVPRGLTVGSLIASPRPGTGGTAGR